MNNTITAITPQVSTYSSQSTKPRIIPRDLQVQGDRDTATFGAGGTVSNDQAMGIVLERSYEKLRGVVADAREALGIPEGEVIDTSPEATATRIADFALGAFDRWYANHEELEQDEARKQFVDFIGGAISQGIDEARGILTALNALTPEVDQNINTTFSIIQDRLKDFAENGQ